MNEEGYARGGEVAGAVAHISARCSWAVGVAPCISHLFIWQQPRAGEGEQHRAGPKLAGIGSTESWIRPRHVVPPFLFLFLCYFSNFNIISKFKVVLNTKLNFKCIDQNPAWCKVLKLILLIWCLFISLLTYLGQMLQIYPLFIFRTLVSSNVHIQLKITYKKWILITCII